MNTIMRKMQRAVALRWLLASTLILATGIQTVACACSSGRVCAAPDPAHADAPSCTCGHNVGHAVGNASAAKDTCCSNNPAPVSPAPPAKGCCSGGGDHAAQTKPAQVADSPADIQAQLVAPQHACPCSMSADDTPAFPAREVAVTMASSSGDPRPHNAIVLRDWVMPSPLHGMAVHGQPEIALRSTVSISELLCTYRC